MSTSANVTVLHRLNEAEIEQAAKLHRSEIPDSFNSRLGHSQLVKAYRACLADSDTLVQSAWTGRDLTGVVVVSLEPSGVRRHLVQQMTVGEWASLAGTIAVHPLLLVDLINQARTARAVTWNCVPVGPVLTAIYVNQRMQRLGVGRRLIASADDFVRKRGYPAYRLDTRASNTRAQNFYIRNGFVEVARRGPDVVYVKEV